MKESRVLRNVIVWDRKAQQSVEIDVDVEIDIGWIAQQLAAKATPLAAMAKPVSAMADR